jgi:hypothetical protein
MQIRSCCAIAGAVGALSFPISGWTCPDGYYQSTLGVCLPEAGRDFGGHGGAIQPVPRPPAPDPSLPPGNNGVSVTTLPIGPVPKCCKKSSPFTGDGQ